MSSAKTTIANNLASAILRLGKDDLKGAWDFINQASLVLADYEIERAAKANANKPYTESTCTDPNCSQAWLKGHSHGTKVD